MNVAPGSTDQLSVNWSTSGATLGVRLLDNSGATTIARATGFVEYPAGSGVYYLASFTYPSTAGSYTLLYDDDGGTAAPGHNFTEDVTVTATVGAAPSTGNLYITRAELKDTLELTDQTYADDDIDIACSAATQVINGYKNTRYHPTTETRTYTAPACPWPFYGTSRAWQIPIDDLNTLTLLKVDMDGDGVYETTWVAGTDFFLGPENAAVDGNPYNTVTLSYRSGRLWPAWQHGIQIVGSFGWAETPDRVRQAAKILAGRYLKRARETPYGLLTIVGDAAIAARLGKIDPDVAATLDNEYGRVPQPWA